MATFVAAIDQTLIATSIPSITKDLNSSSGFAWIGGAFMLANAIAAPIWTKLSDIWGRKAILLTALASFLVASIVCATAKSMNVLILGRTLQGTARGGMGSIVMVTLSDIFSQRYVFHP